MKYLGIDYGSKRIGLAVSDETESFAFPLSVLNNTEEVIKEISRICLEKEIGQIVVGESRNFEMKENDIMKEITFFCQKLTAETKLPIAMHPEFLTSSEAERLQGKNEMLDASAAAIILKSYLDKKKNHGE
jgi:putative holliday junction resolvase